jgi:hypothetical protein
VNLSQASHSVVPENPTLLPPGRINGEFELPWNAFMNML